MLHVPAEDLVAYPTDNAEASAGCPTPLCRKCQAPMAFAARHMVGQCDAHSVAVFECEVCGRLQAVDETATSQL